MVVELDRIFILAEPATNVEGGDADSVQEAKNRRVRVWLIILTWIFRPIGHVLFVRLQALFLGSNTSYFRN